jgi:hypothetical protein
MIVRYEDKRPAAADCEDPAQLVKRVAREQRELGKAVRRLA